MRSGAATTDHANARPSSVPVRNGAVVSEEGGGPESAFGVVLDRRDGEALELGQHRGRGRDREELPQVRADDQPEGRERLRRHPAAAQAAALGAQHATLPQVEGDERAYFAGGTLFAGETLLGGGTLLALTAAHA